MKPKLTNSLLSCKETLFLAAKGQEKMVKKPSIIRMSDFTENCLQVSPEQAIHDLQEFLKENPDFDKVFLIAANNKKGNFLYAWFKGQILCSEAITALHLALDDQTLILKGGDVDYG